MTALAGLEPPRQVKARRCDGDADRECRLAEEIPGEKGLRMTYQWLLDAGSFGAGAVWGWLLVPFAVPAGTRSRWLLLLITSATLALQELKMGSALTLAVGMACGAAAHGLLLRLVIMSTRRSARTRQGDSL